MIRAVCVDALVRICAGESAMVVPTATTELKESLAMRKHEIFSANEKRPRVCQGVETRRRGVRQKDKDARDCYVDD